ncbi:TniQ family protein [Falsiroseomonas oryziterrae]|uniref:TniQ family protein n=1 Tax=Falsiroseomonas oryziterrae TaxID=2911368 RepID=UPI001F343B86|nr:TniQ family protein [Roseomonas sp. NPKOSM-4]
MTGSYSLPDRLEPHPDESLPGLAMRYARLYGFTVVEDIVAPLRARRRYVPSWACVDPASEEGAAFGRLLNLDAERHRGMSNWHPARGTTAVMGVAMSTDATDLWTRQVCPCCLRDSAHHRAAWLVAAIPVCPVHGVRLLRSCPDCGGRLGWRGTAVHRCSDWQCDLDLREVDPQPIDPRDMAGAAGLLAMLGGAAHPSGMAFDDALRAAVTIGALRLGLPRWNRLAGLVERERERLPEILSRGWETLVPWPGAWWTHLEELLAGAVHRPARRGLQRAFGPLADILMDADEGWARALLAEMVDFAALRHDAEVRADVVRRYGTGRVEGERPLSLNEAARMLGVSVDTVTRTAARVGLDAAPIAPGAQRRLRAADVRRLAGAQASADDAITSQQAADILGVSFPTLNRLVGAGLVREIASSDRVKAKLRFRRSDVSALLGAFEQAAEGAPELDSPGPEHRVPGRGGTKDGYGIIRLARSVLSGELKPVAIWTTGSGLEQFLFPRRMTGADGSGHQQMPTMARTGS